jgi:hypothetical protein
LKEGFLAKTPRTRRKNAKEREQAEGRVGVLRELPSLLCVKLFVGLDGPGATGVKCRGRPDEGRARIE